MGLPDREEPTTNEISFMGRKAEALERTRMVRHDGYAKLTSLPEHPAGMI